MHRAKGACLLSVSQDTALQFGFYWVARKELTMTTEIVTKASNGIFLIDFKFCIHNRGLLSRDILAPKQTHNTQGHAKRRKWEGDQQTMKSAGLSKFRCAGQNVL
eukprot:COSAG05_NODE_183_length_14758_cov_90.142506_13_plen_105_part_00